MGRLPHDFVYDIRKALPLPVKLHHFIRVKLTHWRHYLSELALWQVLTASKAAMVIVTTHGMQIGRA